MTLIRQPEMKLKWEEYPAVLRDSFKGHFLNEALADVTIFVEGRSLACHRFVLASASSLLAEVLKQYKPSEIVAISADGFSLNAIKNVLKLLYIGETFATTEEASELSQALVSWGLRSELLAVQKDGSSCATIQPASTNSSSRIMPLEPFFTPTATTSTQDAKKNKNSGAVKHQRKKGSKSSNSGRSKVKSASLRKRCDSSDIEEVLFLPAGSNKPLYPEGSKPVVNVAKIKTEAQNPSVRAQVARSVVDSSSSSDEVEVGIDVPKTFRSLAKETIKKTYVIPISTPLTAGSTVRMVPERTGLVLPNSSCASSPTTFTPTSGYQLDREALKPLNSSNDNIINCSLAVIPPSAVLTPDIVSIKEQIAGGKLVQQGQKHRTVSILLSDMVRSIDVVPNSPKRPSPAETDRLQAEALTEADSVESGIDGLRSACDISVTSNLKRNGPDLNHAHRRASPSGRACTTPKRVKEGLSNQSEPSPIRPSQTQSPKVSRIARAGGPSCVRSIFKDTEDVLPEPSFQVQLRNPVGNQNDQARKQSEGELCIASAVTDVVGRLSSYLKPIQRKRTAKKTGEDEGPRAKNGKGPKKIIIKKCRTCKIEIKGLQNYKLHLSMHRMSNSFCCRICPVRLKTKASLRSHEKYKHNISQLQCPLCDTKFVGRLDREQHYLACVARVAQLGGGNILAPVLEEQEVEDACRNMLD